MQLNRNYNCSKSYIYFLKATQNKYFVNKINFQTQKLKVPQACTVVDAFLSVLGNFSILITIYCLQTVMVF